MPRGDGQPRPPLRGRPTGTRRCVHDPRRPPMAKRPPTIPDSELDVLKVLWDRGQGTVREVLETLRAAGRQWSYATVATLLDRLETKGDGHQRPQRAGLRLQARHHRPGRPPEAGQQPGRQALPGRAGPARPPPPEVPPARPEPGHARSAPCSKRWPAKGPGRSKASTACWVAGSAYPGMSPIHNVPRPRYARQCRRDAASRHERIAAGVSR